MFRRNMSLGQAKESIRKHILSSLASQLAGRSQREIEEFLADLSEEIQILLSEQLSLERERPGTKVVLPEKPLFHEMG